MILAGYSKLERKKFGATLRARLRAGWLPQSSKRAAATTRTPTIRMCAAAGKRAERHPATMCLAASPPPRVLIIAPTYLIVLVVVNTLAMASRIILVNLALMLMAIVAGIAWLRFAIFKSATSVIGIPAVIVMREA